MSPHTVHQFVLKSKDVGLIISDGMKHLYFT